MGHIQHFNKQAEASPSIVSVGQTTIDTIRIDGKAPFVGIGGSAYIPACIWAESGIRVGLVSCVGEDLPTAQLEAKNLDLRGTRIVSGPSSSIEMQYSDQNLVGLRVKPGASNALRMSQIPSGYFNARLFYFSPAPLRFLMELAAAASKHRIETAFSPKEDFPSLANAKMRLLLSRCKFCFLNERELVLVTNMAAEQPAIAALHEAGPEIVIITKGRQGVTISSRETGSFHMKPSNVIKTDNPIGAGDCFAAMFLAASARGQSLRDSAAQAVAYTERWLATRAKSSFWEAKK